MCGSNLNLETMGDNKNIVCKLFGLCKGSDRAYRIALCKVLREYDLGGKPLNVKFTYGKSLAFKRVNWGENALF